MRIPKFPALKFNDIYKTFNRHTFLFLEIGLLLVILVNAVIFYKFVYLPLAEEPERSSRGLGLKNDLLEKYQNNLREREDILKRIESQTYKDIFSP